MGGEDKCYSHVIRFQSVVSQCSWDVNFVSVSQFYPSVK